MRSWEDPGEILSESPCEKILKTFTRSACMKLLWGALIGDSCKKIWFKSSVEGPSLSILSDSLRGLCMRILTKILSRSV